MNLRPFVQEDAQDLIGWLPNAAAAVQWGGPQVPFPIASAFIERLLEDQRKTPPERLCWTAFDPKSAERIGHYQIHFDWTLGQATLCRVLLAPQARGRGYARNLVAHAIDQAFAWQDIHRLELRVFDFNTPAITAYARAGFVREGLFGKRPRSTASGGTPSS